MRLSWCGLWSHTSDSSLFLHSSNLRPGNVCLIVILYWLSSVFVPPNWRDRKKVHLKIDFRGADLLRCVLNIKYCVKIKSHWYLDHVGRLELIYSLNWQNNWSQIELTYSLNWQNNWRYLLFGLQIYFWTSKMCTSSVCQTKPYSCLHITGVS